MVTNVSQVLSTVRKMDIHKISINIALDRSERYNQKMIKYANGRLLVLFLKEGRYFKNTKRNSRI